MFVRIARFEGGTSGAMDAERDRMLKEIEAMRRGDTSSQVARDLARLVSRVEMLVDDERGASAMCVYCETAAQIREIDQILNAMSPDSDGYGRRVSAEIYEVALEEATSLSRAA
jgi:hypothetical protein